MTNIKNQCFQFINVLNFKFTLIYGAVNLIIDVRVTLILTLILQILDAVYGSDDGLKRKFTYVKHNMIYLEICLNQLIIKQTIIRRFCFSPTPWSLALGFTLAFSDVKTCQSKRIHQNRLNNGIW